MTSCSLYSCEQLKVLTNYVNNGSLRLCPVKINLMILYKQFVMNTLGLTVVNYYGMTSLI